MAVTQNTYTGNGSTTNYSFTFPYLETTDIKVSLNGTVTTAYTLANATTVQFNTAPANGAAIRIYRETDDSSLQATFYPGSAIRSSDLNDNFTQNLYVTQEANNVSAAATTTANTALTNSNTAISTANSAVSTANTASSNASAAVSTANTASSNASAAVSTANTASTNASAAVSTANAATATANSAAADAATAISTANSAVSTANAATATANTASTTASNAVSTANTAATNASNAVTTANSAVTTAGNAVTTANSAVSTANSATSTANTALSTANAAASAVANAILYDTVANVAAIPASPANNDAVEVVNSTGIQTFTPLNGLPPGFVGDAGLSVRLVYTTTGSTWTWIQYFPNDPEARYGDAITTLQGDVTTLQTDVGILQTDLGVAQSDILGLDSAKLDATTAASTYLTQANASSTYQTQAGMSSYLTTTAAGTTYAPLASPTFTGTPTGPSFSVTGSAVPVNGVYLPSANTVGISTDGTKRIEIQADGDIDIDNGGVFYDATNNRLGIGTSPSNTLHVYNTAATDAAQIQSTQNFSTLKFTSATNSSGVVYGINGAGGAEIENKDATKSFSIVVGGSEKARLTPSGQWLVGTSTASGNTPLQIKSSSNYYGIRVDGAAEACEFYRYSADQYSSGIIISKSRNATIGSNTIVQNGDSLGAFYFQGANGTGYDVAAKIEAFVDSTPGSSGDMPGRLVFSTTADGASSPTERLRITNTGAIGLSGANYGTSGQVLTSNGSASAPSWQTPAASVDALGAVGAYGFFCYSPQTGTLNPGDTTAGSNLRYSNINGTTTGTSPSGTWRIHGFSLPGSYQFPYVTLWIRIS